MFFFEGGSASASSLLISYELKMWENEARVSGGRRERDGRTDRERSDVACCRPYRAATLIMHQLSCCTRV